MSDQAQRAIAIVGLGGILPDAPDVPTFWQNIQQKRYSIDEVPAERWSPDDYYDPDPAAPDKTYCKIGGWVRAYTFDPRAWRLPIPPAVQAAMDEAQKWSVAACRAALLDYGYPERHLDRAHTAVILGNALAGEGHYTTSLRIRFPEYAHALEAVPAFQRLDGDVQRALIEGMGATIRSRIADITEDTMPGELANILAGRVANLLDLGGPNFVTDAACASSFAALDAAIEGLLAGHYHAVLTGGIDRNMAPATFVKFCKIGALSPDGSRPYAEGANGFVMGEGAVVFLLKRLADAERDGDRIYAVIRGVGGASDGRGKGITAPNPAGQIKAIQRAWQRAGLSPATCSYIEGHGTSTRVGDVIEVESMAQVLAPFDLPRRSIALGSVKSNVGHLKGAAGAAGLLKTALALYHRQLPPAGSFDRPNPAIGFDRLPLYVNTGLRPWEQPAGDGVRRAGVSSFGFGGANFHVVVEEYRPGALTGEARHFAPGGLPSAAPGEGSPAAPRSDPPLPPGGTSLASNGAGPAFYRGALVVGGTDAAALRARLQAALDEARAGQAPAFQAPALADLAAPLRLVIDFGDAAELARRAEKALAALDKDDPAVWKPLAGQGIFYGAGAPGKIAFMFPGQGSQYANMLRALYDLDPIVRETFHEADEVMAPLLGRPLSEYILVDSQDKAAIEAAEERLKDTTITQPAVLTANVALTRLLGSYGIVPDMVIGHSLGEYAALVAAGVLSFAEALHVVSARGREMAKVAMADNGCMAAVMAPLPEVERILAGVDGYVVLANVNSPNQAVIGGATAAVDAAIAAFQAANLRAVKIPVSHAFHTRIVAPASEPLKQVIARMDVRPPRLPVVANVTGDLYPAAPQAIVDLLGQQVASPVQFVKGVETLLGQGARILVEVGPKRVLKALADEIVGGRAGVEVFFTNHPRKGDLCSLNEALCGLYAAGLGGAAPSPDRPGVDPVGDASERDEPPAPPRIQILTATSAVAGPLPRPPARVSMAAAAPVQAAAGAPAATSTAAATPPTTAPVPQNGDGRYLALGRLFAEFLEQGQRIYHETSPVEAVLHPAPARRALSGSVVISGAALGLPGQDRDVFDDDNVRRILAGEQFIELIPYRLRTQMAGKRITRLVKRDAGATFEIIDDPADTIKLAGRRGRLDLAADFGVPEARIEALDISTQLAIAAGIEALRDAGIPLVQRYRTTTKGTWLPERWMLPEALTDETGVIFGSAFPGLDRMADEVTRFNRYQALAEQRQMLVELRALAHNGLAPELERRIIAVEDELARLDYAFDRRFIFRVLAMGHSQFAEYIGARGPNTHVNAACATTTHALAVAEDWIRSGRCRRVIVISGDDATGENLMPWIGSGLLAAGATTTEERLDRAVLPFDRRRNGMVMGMGAAALVLEAEDAVRERGMRGICEVLSTAVANSAFHGTRLDVEHISQVMERLVSQAESHFGLDRRALASQTVFVSHETYTPARGGSASAEIHALRRTFGDMANRVVIANTKGYTGHAMGVGIEDVLAVKALEYGIVPPVANIHGDFQPDQELGDLNLSRGGHYDVRYALRLGAGFGSQIAMVLLRRIPGPAERIDDRATYEGWLAAGAGYDRAELEVIQRTLRIRDQGPPVRVPAISTWVYGTGPSAWAAAPDAQPTGQVTVPPVATQAPPVATPPAPPLPAPEPEAGQAPVKTSLALTESDPIQAQVVALVSEKTGYPPDMLDLDLDLEADLGIDTVKQAEVLAAVREAYSIPRREDLKLRDYNTLAKVIDFVRESIGATVPAAETPAVPQPAPVPAAAQTKTPLALTESDPIQARVVALVSEKTGYPPDMLDLDLDLEADLGIDTVKQAEVLAAVREAYSIPRREDLKLRDYNTLAKVIDFVRESVAAAQAASAPEPAPARSIALQTASDTVQTAPETAQTVPATTPPAPVLDPTAGLEVAAGIRCRVPLPVLRPELEVCKPTNVTLAGRRIVVAGEGGKVGKYVAHRLRARKVQVLALAVDTPQAVAEQAAAWLAAGPIDGLYWLPALDVEPPVMEMDLPAWRAELERRVKALYALLRALPGDPFLVSAVRLDGRHGYGPAGVETPLGGGVTGLTKAYAREHPGALVKTIDLGAEDERRAAEILIQETLADPGAVEIGYHQGRRCGVSLAERPPAPCDPLRLSRDTVLLITGASGGITSTVVADLARASGGTFYLVGSAPSPDRADPDLGRLAGEDLKWLKRDIAQRIQQAGTRPTPVMVEWKIDRLQRSAALVAAMDEIERAGGTAHYCSCNVTDGPAVRALVQEIRERHGRIDVLIHAAGIERSHLLADKDPAEFDAVFDVKADGLWNLLHAAAVLDCLPGTSIAFSSIAGRLGNAGQTDYSAANDLMCKLVSWLRRAHPERKAVAIDWSAWAGAGMAARGSVPEMMRRAGIEMLEPAAAAPIVRCEILSAGSGEIVAAGALGALLEGHDPQDGLDLERANERLVHAFPVAGRLAGIDPLGSLIFETELDPQVEPFLRDHALNETPLLPGVMGVEGFAEVASLAASRLAGGPPLRVQAIEDVQFAAPVKFYRGEPRTLTWRARLHFADQGDSGLVAEVSLESTRALQERAQHTVHFIGRVCLAPAEGAQEIPIAAIPAWQEEDALGPEAIYRVYFHGPAFQVLAGVRAHAGRVVGKLRHDLPPLTGTGAQTLVAPWLIELCLQTAGVWEIGRSGALALPTAWQRLVVHRVPVNGEAMYAEIEPLPGEGSISFNGRVIDEQGNLYLELEGYRTTRLPDPVDEAHVAPLRAIKTN